MCRNKQRYLKKEWRNKSKTTSTKKKQKFTYLKFKPARPITETTEFEHGLLFQKKVDNPGGKQTYASILRKQSNTNIQRKLNKILQKLQIKHQLLKTFKSAGKISVTTINQDLQPQQHQTPTMKTRKSQDKT